MDLVRWPEMQAKLGPRRGPSPRSAGNRKVYPVLALPDGRIIDGHQRWINASHLARLPVRILANVDDDNALLIGQCINLSRARDRDGVVKQVLELRLRIGYKTSIIPRLMTEMVFQGWPQADVSAQLQIDHTNANRLVTGIRAGDLYPVTVTTTGSTALTIPRARRPKEWYTVAVAINNLTKRAEEMDAGAMAATWSQADRDRISAVNKQAAERLLRFCNAIERVAAGTNGVHHEPVPEPAN